MITASVVSKPYPMVVFSNGTTIDYNANHEPFEHNIKNALYSAKLFNNLDELSKKRAMEVLTCGN
jgi:hypothetical protein